MRTLGVVLGFMITAGISLAAATFTVEMQGDPSRFVPADLTVNVGDTVTWVNRDLNPHSTISDVGGWDSDLLFEDDTFSWTFNQVGEFPYYDLYAGVNGIIRVQGAANMPPAVGIMSPTNGATFAAPATFTITATASDTDGSVTNVEFFVGATVLSNRTTQPYTVMASSLPSGHYALTARAVDNLGLASTSGPVTVNIVIPAELRLNPPVLTAQEVRITFTTTPDVTYVLEASINPDGGWVPISTNLASGPLTTVTNSMSNAVQRFFRAWLK
ncbi:MAG: hypothetical protein JXQ71_15275 [Verrucomicrobia bacterium]|nr:hypothetical protein [Verrucomicrobiota bacterium]